MWVDNARWEFFVTPPNPIAKPGLLAEAELGYPRTYTEVSSVSNTQTREQETGRQTPVDYRMDRWMDGLMSLLIPEGKLVCNLSDYTTIQNN